jgi:hypothetical protein
MLKRNSNRQIAESDDILSADDEDDNFKYNFHTTSAMYEKRKPAFQLLFFVLVVIGLRLFSSEYWTLSSSSTTISMPADALGFEIDKHVQLKVAFASDNSNSILLAGHKAALEIDPKKCSDPRIWLRLEGDALASIVMKEMPGTSRWWGEFSIPIPGNFDLVAHWYGCEGLSTKKVIKLHSFTAIGISGLRDSSDDDSLFPKAAWISTKKFPQSENIHQPYIFHSPSVRYEAATLLKTDNSVTSKNGVTTEENGWFQFNRLSNYELVCWFGSDSAQQIRNNFLQERGIVSPGQKPFKFHIYPSDHLTRPDRDWAESEKSRFRKCKHILVSLDDIPDNLSQKDYQKQVETLLQHLQKAFPDETFPIWMFTVNEAPSKATNCNSPFLRRTSHHPCNDALFDLFAKKTLQSRVKLMDNTDVSLPQLGENALDVFSVVALRIFVAVGKQVKVWRDAGQIGHVNGLRKGDVELPNFELVPYTGWN